MGYTNYWYRTEKPITERFVRKVEKIIEESINKGIKICGWDGTGTPKVTMEEINFNGDASISADHESFVIDERPDFNFCKTAEKPYDYTVKEVLKVALEEGLVRDISDDGEIPVTTDSDWIAHREEMKRRYPEFYK